MSYCFVIPLLLLRAVRYISKALSFVVSLTSENSLKYHFSLQGVLSDVKKKLIFVYMKEYNKLSSSVKD